MSQKINGLKSTKHRCLVVLCATMWVSLKVQKSFFISLLPLNSLTPDSYCGLLWLHITHHNTAHLAKGSLDSSWTKKCKTIRSQ